MSNEGIMNLRFAIYDLRFWVREQYLSVSVEFGARGGEGPWQFD